MRESLQFEIVALSEVPTTDLMSRSSHLPPLVLVVDDEHMIADTRMAIFTGWGYACMVAYDAEKALELARLFRPELLLCDVLLKGQNGVELAVEIKQLVPDCKVLLVTGQLGFNELQSSETSRFQDFTLLTKPLHPSELQVHLKRLKISPPINSFNSFEPSTACDPCHTTASFFDNFPEPYPA